LIVAGFTAGAFRIARNAKPDGVRRLAGL